MFTGFANTNLSLLNLHIMSCIRVSASAMLSLAFSPGSLVLAIMELRAVSAVKHASESNDMHCN